jgi:glycerol-3-phosphate O-acyltransferase/dihydroxyacetone phosphate acyltransferase
MTITYWLVKSLSKIITKIYFKTIYVIGEENIPTDGPVIICGNHSNQFIDPMMIMNYCPRDISFTMAASSFNKKVVGSIAKLLNVIPVNRPEDYKRKGTGKIRFSNENKNLTSNDVKVRI